MVHTSDHVTNNYRVDLVAASNADTGFIAAIVGFVAAAVSMPMSGCRARRCLAVVDVVSVTVGPAVL